MSAVYPKEIRADEDDEERELAFEYEEALASSGAGAWVLFPNGVNGCSVELDITAGSGYIEATNDSLQDVKTGTAGVAGVAWRLGTITVSAQDYLFPCTAVRQVNVTGATKLKVRFQ